MTEEDDVFLKILNQKRDPNVDPCTEDIFEEVMNFFEETAQLKQPYASVDNPPVLSYAEMEDTMDATLEDQMKPWAKQIYEHWKSCRSSVQNNSLVSQLKVCCQICHRLCVTADIAPSLKPAKTPTTVIHLSVSVDARFARSARPVVEMHKVQRSSDAFAKSWKMLANSLLWCASAKSPAGRCSLWSAKSSSSVLR